MAKKPESKIQTKSNTKEEVAVSESHALSIVDSIEKNRVILISSAIAVLGLLALVLVDRQLKVQRHLKAGEMYTKAAAAKDIGELDKVVSEYKGSVPAGNALLTKADIQIDQGKPQDAIATLTGMIGEFKEHPRLVQSYYMLANIYHKSEDFAKATENYKKVLEVQPNGEFSPITTIRLGDIELAKGDSEKARQYYEDSYAEFPGNPFFVVAERRIRQIKLKMPTEIDPPKTEAPPAEVEAPPANTDAPPTKAETPPTKVSTPPTKVSTPATKVSTPATKVSTPPTKVSTPPKNEKGPKEVTTPKPTPAGQ